MKTFTVEHLTAQDVDLIALALDAYTSSMKNVTSAQADNHASLLFKFDSLTDPEFAEPVEPGEVLAREGNVIRVSFSG